MDQSSSTDLPPMKLAVIYNVFDGHELLERSIVSVRNCASVVIVVWQRVSNFGDKCNPFLPEFLEDLVERKLIDHLIEYTCRQYDMSERKHIVSPKAHGLEGPLDTIGPQFFDEIQKREIGRQKALTLHCTHFLLMDTDEFYLEHQMRKTMVDIVRLELDATACRMRFFLKGPQWEYVPYDNFQSVPYICKLSTESRLTLAAPFPVLVDPTRRPEPLGRFFLFERTAVEMYHFTYVRLDMKKKLSSVSNRGNYGNTDNFLRLYEQWSGPEDGPIHPHSVIGLLYTDVQEVPNFFGIELDMLCRACFKRGSMVCSRCQTTRYCCQAHQKIDYVNHSKTCKPKTTSTTTTTEVSPSK